MTIDCGDFSESGEEFVIARPDRLPRDWYNCLWNARFLCQLRPDGTGESFYKHPGGMRTRLTAGSRRAYVRDRETGEFCSFPTAGPDERVVIGQGYTTFVRQWQDLHLRLQISVPETVYGELWVLEIANKASTDRALDVFTFMDVDLSGYFTPFQITCLKSEFDGDAGVLVFRNVDACCTSPYFNGFAAAEDPVVAWDAVRGLFVGWNGPLDRPEALLRDGCTNTPYGAYGAAGVLQTTANVPAGRARIVRRLYGVYETREEIDRATASAFSVDTADAVRTGPSPGATEENARFVLDTPDADVNRLFNTWTKHNLRFCVDWTRIYSRGFRDVLQDAMGVASLNPGAARASILEAMEHVYRSGRCVRAWDALSTTLADEFYSDGPVWIPLAVNAWVAETGDTAFLRERSPWLDGGEGTVWEHMLAALRFLVEDRDERGLCRIHDGDWCDTAHLLGRKGRGVGVWLTIACCHAAGEIRRLAEFVGDHAVAEEMSDKTRALREAVNAAGWDGEWFLIAYNDDGRPIGTAADKTARTFLNPQSWAVISGVTTPEREAACLRAIDEHLDSQVGPLLLYPPFADMDRTIGSITGFAPGTIENGSCYCHAASFKIVADCVSGRGDRAYRTLRAIMPGGDADRSNPDADCPPFAFTNSRAAPFHPYLAGRSLGLWATGTVAWCWTALTEWILGVRKTLRGLRVDPCVPSGWPGFSVHRCYRDCEYDITVDNPDRVERGVRSITVNGEPLDGDILPVRPGQRLDVRVAMD